MVTYNHHVLVLPVPQGKVRSRGLLSVYFAPRLRRNGTLDDYPDFVNWATRVSDFTYTVVTDKGALPGTVVRALNKTDVWAATFKGANARRVKAWNQVQRSEGRIVTSATHRMTDLADQMLLASVMQNRSTFTKSEIAAAFPGLGRTAQTIAPYFARVGNGRTPTAASSDIEFHGALRMLGSHPQLLRALGIVVDLQVSNLPTGITDLYVQVNLKAGRPALRQGLFVPVKMKVESGTFVPKADVRGYSSKRFLSLSSPGFKVSQINTAQIAGALADIAAPVLSPAVDGATPIEIPAFADGGLGVVHTGALGRMGRRFTANNELEKAIDAYITAPAANRVIPVATFDDVVAGYRLDVKRATTSTGRWRSAHWRRVPKGITFPGNTALTLNVAPDEGWSRPALSTDGTTTSEPRPSSVSYGPNEKKVVRDTTRWKMSDLLVMWNGWSLSAGKPALATTGSGVVEANDTPTNSPEYPARTIVQYKPVVGTLPSLRYGVPYLLRLRQTDITGGGPVLSASSPTSASSAKTFYGRYAPVLSPIVVRRVSRPDPGVGDEAETIVITSDLGQATNTIASADRLVFPPSVSQSVVERHGLPGDGTDPTAYADLAARDARSLADQTIVDPDTNEPVAGAALVNNAVTQGPLEPPILYLADPMAGGVAGLDLPQQTAPVSVDLGTWPTLEAARLQLSAGTSAPVVDTGTKTITAFLPPGTTHVCRVSHSLPDARVDHMKGYQLLAPGAKIARRAEIRDGRNEAISRSRRVTLVHAVRQPIDPPSFPVSFAPELSLTPISGDRATPTVGETRVTFSGGVGVHRRTSDHLAISAAWSDSVDDTAQAAPGTEQGSAFVGDIVVPEFLPEPSDEVIIGIDALTFDLGDTRRRTLVLSSEAFCRYSRYFTERRRLSATLGATTVLNAAGISATAVEVFNRNTERVFEQGVDYTIDPAAGSITLLTTGGIPSGAPLEIRYLKRPFSRLSTESSENPTASVVIPATVAPLEPEVRTVLPAFQRVETNTSTRRQVVNDGRVLRVLLERPWYSSGDDEKLAVVVDPRATADATLDRGGTIWGRDPIVAVGTSIAQPQMASFPNASIQDDLVDGGIFDAAVHDVAFDTSRRIWISDVLVDATFSYRPFVQLTVARYQPVAVDGAHISPAVRCVATRLGVNRTVTVDLTGAKQVSVTMTGQDSGANAATVHLQVRNSASTDDLLRWETVSSTPLTRTGTAASATFSVTGLSTTVSGNPTRRLVVEETEPVDIQSGATTTGSDMVCFREIVTLPSSW